MRVLQEIVDPKSIFARRDEFGLKRTDFARSALECGDLAPLLVLDYFGEVPAFAKTTAWLARSSGRYFESGEKEIRILRSYWKERLRSLNVGAMKLEREEILARLRAGLPALKRWSSARVRKRNDPNSVRHVEVMNDEGKALHEIMPGAIFARGPTVG